MNTLFQILFLSFGLTYVICDDAAQVQCAKEGAKALEGKTDDQLLALIKTNLDKGTQLVNKRVATANTQGFTCYKKFYDDYISGLNGILQTGLDGRLKTAKTAAEKSDAIKTIALITQNMRCDEKWRAENLNQLLQDSSCKFILPGIECFLTYDLLQFKPKLALLETGLFLGTFGLKLKNNVVSGIVSDILVLYHRIYTSGEFCALTQPTLLKQCSNIKIFVKELDRLFKLIEISIKAKL